MLDKQRTALNRLEALLAERYPDDASARRSRPTRSLPRRASPSTNTRPTPNTWSSILEAARISKKLGDLLEVVLEEYPSLRAELDRMRPALGLAAAAGPSPSAFAPTSALRPASASTPASRRVLPPASKLAPLGTEHAPADPIAFPDATTIPVTPWGRLGDGELFVRARDIAWAVLMKRTWGLDVLLCPRCSPQMRVLATIPSPAMVRKILDHLGLR